LNVVVGYLAVLTQQDLVDIAQKQVEVTKIQVDRSEKLVRAGSQAETALYDIKAQLANDELTVVNAQNNLASARLSLKQTMNMAAERDIQVIRVEVPNPNFQPYPESAQQVYEVAQGFLPDIQAVDLRVKLAQKNIDIAKSFKLPTVSANASLGSSASTAAQQSSGQFIPSEQNFGTVNVNGTDFPLVVKSQTPILESIPYPKQLSGNFNTTLGLTVRIPIFNAYNAKFRLAGAELQAKNAEYQADNARVSLRQSIEQAYINMSNAAKRYSATQNQVTSLEQAFRAAESKFSVGSLNSLDYNISKTNLDRAKSNLVQTKYDYVFRTKILDYYQNKPLAF
jgi:outer membrane protein